MKKRMQKSKGWMAPAPSVVISPSCCSLTVRKAFATAPYLIVAPHSFRYAVASSLFFFCFFRRLLLPPVCVCGYHFVRLILASSIVERVRARAEPCVEYTVPHPLVSHS